MQKRLFPSWAGRLLVLLGALVVALRSTPARAESYLAAEPMTDKKIRIDGMLREWPGGFDKLNQTMRGKSVGAEALVGYDDDNLYVGLKTRDTKIARTRGAGKNEDHLTLYLRFPGADGGAKLRRIDIYPGDPGKLPALVKVDGKTISKAKAVEAPHAKGFDLEASIPWSNLPESDRMRVGLRGVLEYTDASAPGVVRGVVATSKQRGKAMPPLTLEGETGLIQALLEPKALGLTPAREVFGNVTGDSAYERVAVYGHYLGIVGHRYKGGKQFYYNELNVRDAGAIRRLSLLDFDGDGRDEIILEKRVGSDSKHRVVLQVLQVGPGGVPLQVFVHEIGIKTDDGFVKNDVAIQGRGKSARIVISQGKEKGFDPGTFEEPTFEDVPSALLPWSSVRSRTFAWRNKGLAAVDEQTWTPKKTKSSPRASKAAVGIDAPPPPRPPSADEMLDRVYGLYRKDRGLGRKKPSFDFVTDVVEDRTPERVLVHDKDIVVFGKGFKKGLSYTFITAGVKDSKDILDVTARDLTGDGKAEIILRGLLEAKASKELGGDVVTRHALYVYKVIGERLVRIFAAETGRSLGRNKVIGTLAFTPGSRGLEIQLRPGRAVGWTERTYPFPEDRHPAGGLEPLLLPWTNQSPRTYVFRRDSYEQK